MNKIKSCFYQTAGASCLERNLMISVLHQTSLRW